MHVCPEVLFSFPLLLLISLLGCSLISIMYCDSKTSCQRASHWTWDGAGDPVEEVGLTDKKRMPGRIFGQGRAKMVPQSGFGFSLPRPRSTSLLPAPFLSFSLPFLSLLAMSALA